MPVTTRLQERLRAIEAAENAKRTIRSPAPSPIPSSSPSTSPSSSPPSSSPPTRLPTRIINPLISIHGRRSLTHTLHHFQGDITATPFPDFPRPAPIYIPDIREEVSGTGFSNEACFASDEELEYISDRAMFENEWGDELPDLPDYVSDEEPVYEYPTLPGASPAAQPSSSPPALCTEPMLIDVGNDIRGIKRKPSDEGLLTGVENFLDNLPIGRFPASPINTTPAIPDAPLLPANKPKLTPLAAIPMHPRTKDVLTRLQASYLAQHNSSPNSDFEPCLSPIVELPERKCRFYKAKSNYEPEEPNWVPEWPVNAEWQESVSPKISPTGGGTTLYAVGCKGRKRKFEEIKEKMRIEGVLNPSAEPAVKRVTMPGFRTVVNEIEWQRLHDQERDRIRRGGEENLKRTALLHRGRKRSPAREPELLDPRWREGVNRAQILNAFPTGVRR